MMIAPANSKLSSSASSSAATASYYSQGLNTYEVPMSLHATNRTRLLSSMPLTASKAPCVGLILLEGGKQQTRYDTDTEPVFRQESYFHYLFGASSYEGCYGIITLPPFPTEKSKAVVFVPTYDIDVATVCGPSPNFEQVKEELGVDEVCDVNELNDFVEKEMKRLIALEGVEIGSSRLVLWPCKIYLLKGLNTDSGKYAKPAYYEGIERYYNDEKYNQYNRVDETTLFSCLVECRVIKSPAEIELMKYTNWVSSMAHVATMRACQPNMMEYQLESTFLHYTYYYGGMRHMAYTCVCGCGPNSSILHYGHAGRANTGRVLHNGDMALLDMGGEYHCYASDITCSYPVNGVYTDDQRCIYECVLAAQIAVITKLRAGVSWVDMHHLAEREILHGLLKCGILIIPTNFFYDDEKKRMNVNDIIGMMIDVDLGAVFMPHGLGHLIGLDVHDVGGYAPNTPPRSSRPGLKKLRTARTMEAGVVITVEPGCYFIDVLLDMALTDTRQSQYINSERLNDFRGFGGVRLEDDIWVTESGCVNLTQCPRAMDEVVHVMKGGAWPPKTDSLPEIKRAWSVCKEGKMELLTILAKE